MLVKQEMKTYRIDRKCDKCNKGVLIATATESFTTGETIKIIHHKCNECGEMVMIKGQSFPKLLHKAASDAVEITEKSLDIDVEIIEPVKTEEVKAEDSDSIELS